MSTYDGPAITVATLSTPLKQTWSDPWPAWDWPRWLNEYQRDLALYDFHQAQVRFTEGPVVSVGRRFPRHNLFALTPRHVRQAAYRRFA